MIQTLNSARPSILTGVGLTGAGMARARTPMLTVLALGIAVLLIWAASASTANTLYATAVLPSIRPYYNGQTRIRLKRFD